jgi:hypothetical protein
MRTSVQIRLEKMIDNAGARDLIFPQKPAPEEAEAEDVFSVQKYS